MATQPGLGYCRLDPGTTGRRASPQHAASPGPWGKEPGPVPQGQHAHLGEGSSPNPSHPVAAWLRRQGSGHLRGTNGAGTTVELGPVWVAACGPQSRPHYPGLRPFQQETGKKGHGSQPRQPSHTARQPPSSAMAVHPPTSGPSTQTPGSSVCGGGPHPGSMGLGREAGQPR